MSRIGLRLVYLLTLTAYLAASGPVSLAALACGLSERAEAPASCGCTADCGCMASEDCCRCCESEACDASDSAAEQEPAGVCPALPRQSCPCGPGCPAGCCWCCAAKAPCDPGANHPHLEAAACLGESLTEFGLFLPPPRACDLFHPPRA